MSQYRWNQHDVAAEYDTTAPLIHPYYAEIQRAVLDALPFDASAPVRLVDLGGGSGRLVEMFLNRWPRGTATVLDQSESFLAIAADRLQAFGDRVSTVSARLQDDWSPALEAPVDAFVSMSAIHHLEPAEKQQLLQRVHGALAPGGVFVNGDECRAADDAVYLAHVRNWAGHMNDLIAQQRVSATMAETLRGWQTRNVDGFGGPRKSGDDCHETVDAQLDYLRRAGFSHAESPWQKDLWAVLVGRR